MCLRPITLVNPKLKMSLYGALPYNMEVPCGSCAECNKVKQLEWYYRAYYESKYTFDNGGYIYFDTLTYRDSDLPHVSDYCSDLKESILDYPCFNKSHIRLFMVNLRRLLTYYGYDVKDKLKYFISSEYGVDDNYSHRPHYHILLYMLDDNLSPILLSKFVSKCWPYGRTDGVEYKGTKYVLNHTFGKKYCSDEVHMLTVCNYVAKYVTKDNKFLDTLDDRLKFVMRRLYGKSKLDEDMILVRNLIRRNMSLFHRLSNGFGLSFTLYNDMNSVIETGMISMPDKNNIVKHIPLPMYYSRKLFYDLIKDSEGRNSWKLNLLGVDYKLRRKKKSIDLLTLKFKDWHLNMCNHNLDLRVNMLDIGDHKLFPWNGFYSLKEVDEWYDRHILRFDELLGDRSIKDFVTYLLCYKGRIKSPRLIERENEGIYYADDLDDFIVREFDILQDEGYKLVYNYAHYVYKKFLGIKVVSDKYLGDSLEGLIDDSCQGYNYVKSRNKEMDFIDFSRKYKLDDRDYFKTVDEFLRKYVIDDTCSYEFTGFDEMYWIWCDSLMFYNNSKLTYHDWRKEYLDRMKVFGLSVSSL